MLLGIMAIGMIFGSVFWLTYRIDRLEREGSEKLVELMVTERVTQLQEVVADYSHWDTAYDIVLANDGDAVYSELGVSAKPGGIFSHVFVLDTNLNPLFLYDESGPVDEIDLKSLEPFLNRLRRTSPQDQMTISGIGSLEGGYGAVAVAYITPTSHDLAGLEPVPILIGVKMFTEDALNAIAKLTQNTGYAIKPLATSENGPNVPLIGPDGKPIAELVWTSSKIGTVLRAEIMPGILFVCLSISGICLSAASYFHRQGKALKNAFAVATTDRLTGLVNRAGLEEILQSPATDAMLAAGKMAVLYIDLNNFKKLNDHHGHKAGDQALKLVARRLRESIRATDHVVRLGGDEFICVILDEAPLSAARTVSERLMLACAVSVNIGDVEISLVPAIGISVATSGESWEILLGRADTAMFHAKRRGKRTAVIYGEGDDFYPHEIQRKWFAARG